MKTAEAVQFDEKIDDSLASWVDIYGSLDQLKQDLILECQDHIGELQAGTYHGPRLSEASIQQLIKRYEEEIEAIQRTDPNDTEAVRQIVIHHIARMNARQD